MTQLNPPAEQPCGEPADRRTDRLPMPPAEFLAAVTMVGERAAAGYGWQEGYLAGRAAAAADIRAFADKKERSAKDYPPKSAEAFRRNDAVLGAYRRAAEIAEEKP